MVRARCLIKSIGLDGLRISMILRSRAWRDDLERVLETAGASIDRYSLMSAVALTDSPWLLPAMFKATKEHVTSGDRAASS